MDNKAQISPDFLVAIIFLGLIALAIFGTYGDSEKEAFDTIEAIKNKGVADKIAKGIDDASIMGDGSQNIIELPYTLSGGDDYNVTLRPHVLLLYWKDGDVASRYFTGNLNQSEINLTAGDLNISNINGTVYVQNMESRQ